MRDLSVTAVESRRRLLERVDLTIAPGERVAVIGHSGAGKTLLARAMVGVLPKGIVATGEIACLFELPTARMKGVPVRRLTRPRIPAPPEMARTSRWQLPTSAGATGAVTRACNYALLFEPREGG